MNFEKFLMEVSHVMGSEKSVTAAGEIAVLRHQMCF